MKLVPFTPNTITTREGLNEELEKIRKTGSAIDNEELAIGLRCVSAPVFDYTGFPSYAISIAGPTTRMTNEVIERMQKEIVRTCARLSSYLGEPGHVKKYGEVLGQK